jgi:trans-o-hydroxybenzylidenepyruvate hydratase-aldolase
MKAFRDIGAEAAFVGLPLWQTPSIETQIGWFADLSAAVPDMGIMVYSNSMFFKSTFPYEFWVGVAKNAPTVITNKISSPAIMDDLEKIVEATGDRISYLPIDTAAKGAWERVGDRIRGMWSTDAPMGPEPVVALSKAIQSNDKALIEQIHHDIESPPSFFPPNGRVTFPQVNAQAEKVRFRAAGYINCGPTRAPYLEKYLPAEWKASAEANGRGWAEMRKKYVKAAV